MSFARYTPATRDEKIEMRQNRPVYSPVERAGVMTGGVSGRPIEKGAAARPGKRAQTKQEQAWIASVITFGCVACWLEDRPRVPPEVHHLIRGGVRMGHLYSIGLCAGHHRQGAGPVYMVARHPAKARFEAQYGSEWHLLDLLRDETGVERLTVQSREVDREISRQLGSAR